MKHVNLSWIALVAAAIALIVCTVPSRMTPTAKSIPSNIEFLGNREVLDRSTGKLYMYGNGWDKAPSVSFEFTEVGKPFRVP